jgi:hypothetical protein
MRKLVLTVAGSTALLWSAYLLSDRTEAMTVGASAVRAAVDQIDPMDVVAARKGAKAKKAKAKAKKKEPTVTGFTWKDFYTPPVGPWFGPDWPVGRPIKKYGFCWVNSDVALRDQFGYWKVC